MKDPIEEALEGMEPAPMSPDLMARLTALRPRLDQSQKPRVWRRWFFPLAFSGAAAVLALSTLQRADPPQAPARLVSAPAQAIPVERSDYLVATREMGVVVAPDQRPYRVMEIEWLERDTLPSSKSGRAMRVETRRREIVPVVLETF